MISFKKIHKTFTVKYEELKSAPDTEKNKSILGKFDHAKFIFGFNTDRIGDDVNKWKKGKEFNHEAQVVHDISEDELIPKDFKYSVKRDIEKTKKVPVIIKRLERVFIATLVLVPLMLATSLVPFSATTILLTSGTVLMITAIAILRLKNQTVMTEDMRLFNSNYKENFAYFINKHKVDYSSPMVKVWGVYVPTVGRYQDVYSHLDSKIHDIYKDFANPYFLMEDALQFAK